MLNIVNPSSRRQGWKTIGRSLRFNTLGIAQAFPPIGQADDYIRTLTGIWAEICK